MRRAIPLTGVLRAAVDAHRREHKPRRHSADVTADRLVDHAIEWDKFDGAERDAIGVVVKALREIAEGER